MYQKNKVPFHDISFYVYTVYVNFAIFVATFQKNVSYEDDG